MSSQRDPEIEGRSDKKEWQSDWLEEIDHTADVGFIVRAYDLPDLFAHAAWGMFSIITDVANVASMEARHVKVDAPDRAALLVAWLSELNYLHIVEHRLFSKFNIRRLTDEELEADVFGERIDPARHPIYTEIKAVTFHDVEIVQVGGEWRTQIIFDL